MSIEKQTVIGLIEVTPDNRVLVRTDTLIIENGNTIGEPQYHRHVIVPGDDYSAEDLKVQAICEAVHAIEH